MLFNTLGFIFFFILVLILYYSPIFNWKGKKVMLLVASYIFYGLWNPPLILLLWISTLVDWTAGNKIFRLTEKNKRKLWLVLSICVNLGFLGFFKYGNFMIENFQSFLGVFGIEYTPPEMDIILPMGISFYTFQTMSYTIDMYRNRIQPAKTFLDFALYVTFFPQLVAGPIVRSDELIPQFYEPKKATQNQFVLGMLLLTIGLFEKTVFADSLFSDVSDSVFGSKDILPAIDAWTGVLAFSGQIFFDFAGYSLCAIGIALTLGIGLPDNFRYPYGAIGFSDLWGRWHISLSSWLRDYLYIPLGGNRGGVSRTYVNLMMTMLLGGLWHGAGWTFIFWGFLHGFYLIIERLLKNKVHIKTENVFVNLLLAFLTFQCVNITWVFFRAQDFKTAMNILGSMFFIHTGKPSLWTSSIVFVLGLMVLVFIGHFMMRKRSLVGVIESSPRWLVTFIWGLMIFGLLIVQTTGQQFIYFQF
ncbi:MBOAT family O-acyltransferase [Marinigracilibium pacificum]|uniref:MBOAT family protein n=1 Tax=Marinigracilibium pacificum TaxID=2729599 RepID=A0A848IZ84_9BACT|nr:MBOAT family protein [Marinigracilibium pacificum]NMM47309.1 MBOAT family protein [Marinigracilibium pacificum]